MFSSVTFPAELGTLPTFSLHKPNHVNQNIIYGNLLNTVNISLIHIKKSSTFMRYIIRVQCNELKLCCMSYTNPLTVLPCVHNSHFLQNCFILSHCLNI